ncbi:MAG: hypothetical protein P4K94_08520 [Terracidiphilus sp.]|nr:hypothetical protein [Terracidiphilus sp.]
MTKQLLQGQELEQRAQKLGIDIQGGLITASSSGRIQRASDDELQQRVIEAERANRESRLWLLALISALASVISALAAWAAILRK